MLNDWFKMTVVWCWMVG